MPRLYDLTGAWRDVWEMAQDPGADPEAIEDTLQGIEAGIEEKAAGIVMLDRSVASDADAVEAEIRRLQGRKKALEAKRERIRQHALSCLQAAGISKVSTPVGTVSVAKGQRVAAVEDESLLPGEFWAVERRVAKAALTEALKAGREVPGAALRDGSPHLAIR